MSEAVHDLLDVPSQIVGIGSAVGLAPVARCLALTATVTRGRAYTHPTLAPRRAAVRAERALEHPIALSAHQTVLVFRADPHGVDSVLAKPVSPPSTLPPRSRRITPDRDADSSALVGVGKAAA
ncbi:hypothetical protein ACFWIW_24525 [Amycolatopsis sp. NPDC058340]|uniref:hypothetical protein n=1 Tax=Amycolatopsis sp. NPDC058340 TaxID=3346453 RepID=UPI003669F5A9